jgi:beta-N-acetylhexosaminidase
MPSGSLRRQIGRLLIAGFGGHQVPVELASLAREFSLGGVILFARNVVEPEQVAELCYESARLVPDLPLWVSVDQEGGRVARLKAPFTEWPPMATLGRSGDVGLAERFARALATELKAAGITLDYAPVLDILTNPKNPVIGDRALADKAEDVGRLGAAIIRTLQAEGVAACGKHFPGHGDTSVDSHLELPLLEHPPDRFRAVEFVPFRAAVQADVATIMTAHVFAPALDEQRPATLSRRVVTDLLRKELGFEGVILSDDLEMKAIAHNFEVPDAAVLAIGAGCDGVLICSADYDTQARTLESLVHAVESERLPYSRVEDALKRQQRAKERFLGAAMVSRPAGAKTLRQIIGRDEHRAIADEMARFL